MINLSMDMLLKDEFLAKISSNKEVALENVAVSSGKPLLEVDLSGVKERSYHFKGIRFKNQIRFKNGELSGCFTFYQCEFEGGIGFDNVNISYKNESMPEQSIMFMGCAFHGGIAHFENCNFEKDYNIEYCHNIGGLTLKKCQFLNLRIKESTIAGGIRIASSKVKEEFRFDKNVVDDEFLSIDNSYQSIVLDQSMFKKPVLLDDVVMSDDFVIVQNVFQEEVRFEAYEKTVENTRLTIENNTMKQSFKIMYYTVQGDKTYFGGPDKIHIYSNLFENGLELLGSNDSPMRIKELKIIVTNTYSGLIKVSNFNLQKIRISGENYKGNIILKRLMIDEIEFNSFANYSNFQMINCKANEAFDKSALIIKDSHLEKFQFTGCRLDTYKIYHIVSSNLSMVRSSNTIWFDYKNIESEKKYMLEAVANKNYKGELAVHFKTGNTKYFYTEVKELFRQLKYAMDQQGDKVNFLFFKSYEMEAYYQLLKIERKANYKDILILWLGKTNSHGINWIRPFGLLLFSTLVYYLCILFFANPFYKITGTELYFNKYFSEFWQYKKVLPQLLNPTQKLVEILPKGYYANGWVHSFDLFFKVCFSFFLFQMIVAFRKFIK